MYFLNNFSPINGHESHLLQAGIQDALDVNVHSGGTGKVSADIADQFIPEIWGQAIDDVFEQYTMMSNLGMDLSPNVANAGDVIN